MTLALPFRRIVILGLGLIGGSIGLALREAGFAGERVGLDPDPDTCDRALASGALTRVESDLAGALAGADLVILATPLSAMPDLLAALASLLEPGAVLTDCASAKGGPVAWARALLADRMVRFVPGHPIAGSAASGFQAASAGLFRGRGVVLCPLPETDPLALEAVAGLWRACGAEVTRLDPDRHDRVFAAVSHLPQLLAFALVDLLARREDAEQLFAQAGPGFRSVTRIAASSPALWRDICLTNRAALLAELRDYRGRLGQLEALLEASDGPGLQAAFGRATEALRRYPGRD